MYHVEILVGEVELLAEQNGKVGDTLRFTGVRKRSLRASWVFSGGGDGRTPRVKHFIHTMADAIAAHRVGAHGWSALWLSAETAAAASCGDGRRMFLLAAELRATTDSK